MIQHNNDNLKCNSNSKNQQCTCIVCGKNHEIVNIYSMYLFCSEKCYSNYRKLPTKKQLELQE